MDGKITLHDIVDLLVQRQNIARKDAEVFVKAMFDLIEEGLDREKCVKVKGLGVFKLINVENRESVNVNTGERFEIQGHTKISFIPDTSVKELINGPFSHLEPVSLDENPIIEDEFKEDFLKNVLGENKKEQYVDGIERPVSDGEPLMEGAAKRVEKEEKVELSGQQDAKVRKGWYLVLAIILCIGSYGMCKLLVSSQMKCKKESNNMQKEVKMIEKQIDLYQQETKIDTLELLDKVQEKDTMSLVQINVSSESKKDTVISVNLSPTEEYEIQGVWLKHTVRSGETLRKISLKYYGTKELYGYIVTYNELIIKNPDNLPIGSVIKIPKLKQKMKKI